MAIKRKTAIKPTSLRINRLRGCMLVLPAPKGKAKDILLVYGLHASLESVRPLAEVLNQYGKVTVADLPGMGGMTSFYSIGEKPTTSNYGSYLASFI
jgi:hypothetical protein